MQNWFPAGLMVMLMIGCCLLCSGAGQADEPTGGEVTPEVPRLINPGFSAGTPDDPLAGWNDIPLDAELSSDYAVEVDPTHGLRGTPCALLRNLGPVEISEDNYAIIHQRVDATGLTWPDPGLAWPIDPYTTRTVALGVPGLSSYGPRGFDQYNGNEILHLNSLDVSTLANGGSWIYQWVSQDYMQVMDVTQAGAVLAGAVLRGASADDVGLCYLSELGDSPHDRSIWFCDTAAGYLRYTYELPGWSGVYLEHPVALCRYSGNTIPASDKMLVVYQGESGIEFLQEQ